MSSGYLEEYFMKERCFAGLINNPGISLVSNAVMGISYFVFLIYLFLGIAISSDIFMESIEVITS